MRLVKLGLISILASGALFAGTYNVDKSHSSVGFKVKHMMISNVKGSFDEFKGSFVYDEETKKLTALTGTIDAASINTANKKRDDHLKSEDFFDTAKYPELTFVLKKVDGDNVYGDLTMHGVTKEVKLELEDNGTVKDPWGNTRVGLTLEGKIDRKEFGLVYNSILEAGGVAIGDKVKLEIELEGILKK
eukprot:Anaeramoba_ignava/a607714_32.p2 GENE.a607714_32~~a607714_32.p2  ORF type:complete len:189 (+),score=-2.07 a607714_32:571-1137(+)